MFENNVVWNQGRTELAPRRPTPDIREFHSSMPGYAASRILELPEVARELGLGHVVVKDESSRLGLPAFKILGASWAVATTLWKRFAPDATTDAGAPDSADAATDAADVPGSEEQSPHGAPRPGTRITFDALRALVLDEDLTLVTATDGNHGRAVARMAGLLGLRSRVFVPDDLVPDRIEAIRSEGAEMVLVHSDYDESVRRAAEWARTHEAEGAVLIQDTSWPGYEEVPAEIVWGYSTILLELDEQLAERGLPQPDAVLVPSGVGSFPSAVVAHYGADSAGPAGATPVAVGDGPAAEANATNDARLAGARAATGSGRPHLVTVEPDSAACAAASIAAGTPVEVPGPHTSIMSGLNCGVVSALAWPVLRDGLSAAVVVDDDGARAGMRALAAAGLAGGECSGAAVAGLRNLLAEEGLREPLGLGPESVVVLFATEGVTDPSGYEAIIAG